MKCLVVLIFSFLIFGCNSATIGDCTLGYNFRHPGIFVSQASTASAEIVTSPVGKIDFANGASIQAFCSSTFSHLGKRTNDGKFTNITFTCNNGHIFYTPGSNQSPVRLHSSEIDCKSEAQFYKNTVPYCQDTGLEYGFSLLNTPISLAEVCLVPESSRVNFVHFVVGSRSNSVQKQSDLNPSDIKTIVSPTVFTFSDQNIRKLQSFLNDVIKAEITQFIDEAVYEFASLADLEQFTDIFAEYTRSFAYSDLIPWWSPLKYGNWRGVLAAIQNLQSNGVYDVYMGTSGNVSFPSSFYPNGEGFLTYLDDEIEKAVPQLVWSYVKQRNSQDKGVTIIGVNTPFFDQTAKNALLCNDVCHNVDWLAGILPTSHMPALGYVYCCNPDDVQKLLEGFPQIDN